MARHRVQAIALVSTAFAAVAMNCDTGPGQSDPDGGPSVGGAEAGVDAAIDAPPDTAQGSAASGGGDPGWQPVGWPVPCPVEVATNPIAGIPKLKWGACPTPGPGCEAVVINWEYDGAIVSSWPHVVPWGDGYRVGLLQARPGARFAVGIFETDGTPLAAWRTTGDSCLLTNPKLTTEGVWLGAHNTRNASFIYEAYDALSKATQAIQFDNWHPGVAANESLLALEHSGTFRISMYDHLSKQVSSFGTPDEAHWSPQPVGDVGLFLYWPGFEKPEAWIWKRSSQDVEPLIQPDGQHVIDIKSDGSTLVWLQVPSGKEPSDEWWPQGDLWTSPFATSKSEVVAAKRRLAPIMGWVTSAIGKGYYAVYSFQDEQIHVYRLSDAHHWSFAPQQANIFRTVAYVDPQAVWYLTYSGIYRQSIDALGPGD